jgi:hypothetical protein
LAVGRTEEVRSPGAIMTRMTEIVEEQIAKVEAEEATRAKQIAR